MGRPRVLTPEKKDRVISALKRGSTISAAYRSVGVSKSAFNEERERDEDFGDAVTRARAHAQLGVEQALFGAATEKDAQGRRDTKAALQWLTNQDSDSWKERRSDQGDVFQHDVAENRRRQARLSDAAKEKLRKIAKAEILREAEKPGPGESVH